MRGFCKAMCRADIAHALSFRHKFTRSCSDVSHENGTQNDHVASKFGGFGNNLH